MLMGCQRTLILLTLITISMVSIRCESLIGDEGSPECTTSYDCQCEGLQIYHDGQCKYCQVENCFLCDVHDPLKCDTCFQGYELKDDYTQCGEGGCFENKLTCPCGDGEDTMIGGFCQSCQVEGCFLCNVHDYEQCDVCLPGYELSEDYQECGLGGCFENKATCLCDAMDIYFEGECMPCQVLDCFLCNVHDPYKCDSCLPGFEPNEDFSQCGEDGCFENKATCLCDAMDIYFEGECMPCQVLDCFLCNVHDPYKCDSCLPGFEPNEDFSQCGEDGCFENKATCLCDAMDIYFEGECMPCQVLDCFLCNVHDPYKCDSCLPGFEPNEDFSQCGEDGCFENKATCLCDAMDIYFEGECMPCQVLDCFLCNVHDPYKCDSCLPGFEPNEDFSQCGEDGCFENKATCLCDAMDIYFEGECMPCQVLDCFLCNVHDPYKCDSCLPGFEPNEDFSQCGEDGCFENKATCLCDAMDIYFEGECMPCQVLDCFLCNVHDPYKCDSCLPGFEPNEDFSQCGEDGCFENKATCLCDAMDIYFEGECMPCQVLDCFLCNVHDPYKCDSCLPGFHPNEDFSQCGQDGCFENKATCLCDVMDIYFEGECMPCQVLDCFLCNVHDPYKCDSCLPGFEPNEDFSQCGEDGCFENKATCLCDAMDIYFEGECMPCQVLDCFLCNVHDPYKCDSCLPGFEPNEDFSQCGEDGCFENKATCLCDAMDIYFEGECMPCQVLDCFLCNVHDPYKCDSCLPGFEPNEDFSQCGEDGCFENKATCLCDAMDIYFEGECMPCQVLDCFLCNVHDPYKCDSCLPGFEPNEDFSQCGEDGCFENKATCLCDAMDIYFEGECMPCQVLDCFLCNVHDPYKCDSCLPGFEPNEDFSQCGEDGCFENKATCLCDAMDIYFEGECMPCQVLDCFLCNVHDPYKCDSCLPGFEPNEDFSQCGEDGCFENKATCLCDAMDIYFEGECMPCQVLDCFLCNVHDPYKCDSCLPGFEPNEDFTQCGEDGCFENKATCLCDAMDIYFEGECMPCQVLDCFLCNVHDPYKCDSCLPGFEPNEDFSQCGEDGCFENKATCLCDAMDIYFEGECMPCQVLDCFLCNVHDPYKCDSCLPGFEPNEDFSQCGEDGCFENKATCLCDAMDIYFEGECMPCQVLDCFLCNVHDPYKCDSCLPGFEPNEDFSQCGEDGCFENKATCLCDAMDIYFEGECMPCQVLDCFLCNVHDPYKCDSCLPGFEPNEDFSQCGEDGCFENKATCLCDAMDIYFEGECMPCQVLDCFLCNVHDPYKCDSCLPGFEPNEDFSQCGEDGCFENKATCLCDAMDIYFEGECMPCQVLDCFLCNVHDPYKCDSCLPGFEPNEDFSQCGEDGCFENKATCLCDAMDIYFEGECMPCQVLDCFLCNVHDPYQCDSCLPGFHPNEDFSQCGQDGCFENKATCPCNPMDVSYYGECMACQVEECFLCNVHDPYLCDSCLPGFDLSQDFTQCGQDGCYQNKHTCPCGVFQVSINNNCVDCVVENCFLCSLNNRRSCDICHHDHILNQNGDKCIPSSEAAIEFCEVRSCSKCLDDDNTKCQECKKGFQLSQDKTECEVPGCAPYLIFDGSDCNCPKKFYHDEQNGECVACPQNCQSCSSSRCDTCFKGYYEGQTGCEVCTDHCQQCTAPNQCDSCKSGYRFNEESGACERLSGGVSGVVSVGNKQVECIGGCAACSAVDTCQTCETGYYKSDDSICLPCHSSCKACDGETQSDCTDCYTNFVLDNSNCVTCDDIKCLSCSSAAYCSDCVIGFYSKEGTCTLCLDFCLECIDGDTCEECDSGYVYMSGIVDENGNTGNACIQCPEGCSGCNQNDIGECQECSDGYYNKTSTGKCQSCVDGCETCTSQTVCTSCSSGYRQVGYQCLQACQFPCAGCQQDDPTACTDCYGGYALDEGTNTCEEDLSCNDDDEVACEACPRTYSLIRQRCEACDAGDNCVKCSTLDVTKCTQCETGYYLENDACTACPSSCTACWSDSYCTFCDDGFYMASFLGLPTGKCESCSEEDFCLTCRGTASRCTSCIDEYTLKGFKCRSDKGVSMDMTLDTNYDQFIVKINKFKLGLLNLLGDQFKGKLKLLTILSIKEGSVDLEAALTVPENSTAEDSYDTLNGALVEGTQVGGISLTKSNVAAEGFTADDDDDDDDKGEEEQQEESNNNLALALGIGIPLLIILVIIIIIINVKRGKDTEDKYEIAEHKDTDHEKIPN